jgi:hypothetical protein
VALNQKDSLRIKIGPIGATSLYLVEANATGAIRFQSDLRPVAFGGEASGRPRRVGVSPADFS